MVEKIYFVENTAPCLDEMLDLLIDTIPCFLEREFVEMDFSKITIKARVEDLRTVENFLAAFV